MRKLERTTRQGNSSPVVNVVPKSEGDPIVMDGNWTCSTKVVDCDGNEVMATRDVPVKNAGDTAFLAGLTSAETATLDAAQPYTTYSWLVQLENLTLTPPYVVEDEIILKVIPQGI